MDDGYRKVMEILEANRFRHLLETLDYTVSWEEPDRVKGLDISEALKQME